MRNSKLPSWELLVLLAVCLVVFWWRLGRIGLIDPDEPFYAQTARGMAGSGDWVTPKIYGSPQFEKPVFYYWCVAACFEALGESEFAGRLPSALSATAGVLMVFWFGARLFGRRAAFLSALVLATGLQYALMSRLMLTDMVLMVFLTGSLFSLWEALRAEGRTRDGWMFLHMLLNGLAVLTKGPIGIVFPLLVALPYLLATKTVSPFRGRGFLWGCAAFAAVTGPWFGVMGAMHGKRFWEEFILRDNIRRVFLAEHASNNHWYYYVVILCAGALPWFPLAAITVRRAFGEERRENRRVYLWCWVLPNLLFLTAAASKLPSYALPLFVPLALLMGTTLASVIENGFRDAADRRLVLGAGWVQWAVIAGVPFVGGARPFLVPAILVGLILGVGLLLLHRRLQAGWAAANVMATFVMIAAALGMSAPGLELMSSSRPLAARLKDLKGKNEPILGTKHLVRGIYYYLQREGLSEPIRVLADNPRPFWAEHPLQVVVWNEARPGEGRPPEQRGAVLLGSFLRERGSALCVARKPEWDRIQTGTAISPACSIEFLEAVGESVIFRARNKFGGGAAGSGIERSSLTENPSSVEDSAR